MLDFVRIDAQGFCRRAAERSSWCPGPSRSKRVSTRIVAKGIEFDAQATLASLTSPLPVKPAPCQASARPMPARRAPALAPTRWPTSRLPIFRVAVPRGLGPSARGHARTPLPRSRARGPPAPATLSRSTCPVGVSSPMLVHPFAPQFERRHAERLGDAVDLHLGRELCLRRAEAAEGAVGRRVGRHRAAQRMRTLGQLYGARRHGACRATGPPGSACSRRRRP